MLTTRQDISRRIAGSFAAQLVGNVGLLIERFGLAALFIVTFGVDEYKSWLETASWCGLLSLFSFGLNSWCGNIVAEAGDDTAGQRRAIQLTLCVAVASTALAAAAVLVCLSLGIGPSPDQRGVALWLAVAACLKMAEAFLTGALRGLGRMALGLWIAAAGQATVLALSIALLLAGFSMLVVAAGQAAGWLIMVLVMWTMVQRNNRGEPGSTLHGSMLPTPADWRDLRSRGLPYAVANFTNIASVHLTVLLIARVEGLVGFVLIRTITNLCRQVMQQLSYAVADEVARGLAGPDPAAAGDLFGRAARWIGSAAGLMSAWTIWTGVPLVMLITQDRVVPDPALLWLLAGALPITAPALLLGGLCLFSNQGRPLALSQTAAAAALAMIPLGTHLAGPMGAGAVLVLADIAAGVMLLLCLTGPARSNAMRTAILRGAAGGGAALILGWLSGAMAASVVTPQGMGGLLEFSAVWVVLCLPMASWLLLNGAERQWLARRLNGVTGKIRSSDA